MTTAQLTEVRTRAPALAGLLPPLALAAAIDAPLVRALRRRLAPAAGAALERELWACPLVATRTAETLALRADAVDAVRAELAVDRGALDGAWASLTAARPAPQPLVALEERVTYRALRHELGEVERELLAVVRAMVDEPARRRDLSSWAALALARVPAAARTTEAAAILAAVARSWVATPRAVALLEPSLEGANLAATLTRPAGPPVDVKVRLVDGWLELGGDPAPPFATIKMPAGAANVVLDEERTIALEPRGVTRVRIDRDDVMVRGPDGRRWRVAAAPALPDLTDIGWIMLDDARFGVHAIAPDLVATSAGVARHVEPDRPLELPPPFGSARLAVVDADADVALLRLERQLATPPLVLADAVARGDAWQVFVPGSSPLVRLTGPVTSAWPHKTLTLGWPADAPPVPPGTPVFSGARVIGQVRDLAPIGELQAVSAELLRWWRDRAVAATPAASVVALQRNDQFVCHGVIIEGPLVVARLPADALGDLYTASSPSIGRRRLWLITRRNNLAMFALDGAPPASTVRPVRFNRSRHAALPATLGTSPGELEPASIAAEPVNNVTIYLTPASRTQSMTDVHAGDPVLVGEALIGTVADSVSHRGGRIMFHLFEDEVASPTAPVDRRLWVHTLAASDPDVPRLRIPLAPSARRDDLLILFERSGAALGLYLVIEVNRASGNVAVAPSPEAVIERVLALAHLNVSNLAALRGVTSRRDTRDLGIHARLVAGLNAAARGTPTSDSVRYYLGTGEPEATRPRRAVRIVTPSWVSATGLLDEVTTTTGGVQRFERYRAGSFDVEITTAPPATRGDVHLEFDLNPVRATSTDPGPAVTAMLPDTLTGVELDQVQAWIRHLSSTIAYPARRGPANLTPGAVVVSVLPGISTGFALRRGLRFVVEVLSALDGDMAHASALLPVQISGVSRLSLSEARAQLAAIGGTNAEVASVDPDADLLELRIADDSQIETAKELVERAFGAIYAVHQPSPRPDLLHGRFGLSAARAGRELSATAEGDRLVLTVTATEHRPLRGHVTFYVPVDRWEPGRTVARPRFAGTPATAWPPRGEYDHGSDIQMPDQLVTRLEVRRIRASGGVARCSLEAIQRARGYTVGAVIEDEGIPLELFVEGHPPPTAANLAAVGFLTTPPAVEPGPEPQERPTIPETHDVFILEQALASNLKTLGDDHPSVATDRSNLATVLQARGDLPRAKDLLEQALASNLKALGDDHPSVALALSNLAGVLQDLGDLPRAKDLLEQALASNLKALGDDHPSVALGRSNLAGVLQDLGDLPRAKVLLEQALASNLQNLGEDHPSVANSRSNLALVLKDLGDLPGAKVLLEQALASDLQNLGEDHPSVATRRSNLALVLKDLGDLPGAKVLLEQALASDLQNLGDDHPSVATSRSNLALVLKALGDLPRAKVLLEQALASNLQNLGDDHPSVATRRSNLALVLQALGDLPRAKVLLEQALASNLQNLGNDHPNVASSRSNLATVLQALGDLPRAKVLLEQALASDLQNLGDDHPSVANSRSNLALVLKDLGDLPGAKDLLEQALASNLQNLGDDHPSVATCRSNLAGVLQDLGDLPRAKVLLEQALASELKNLGDDHPSVATSRSNLALVLQALGDLSRAKVLLEQALASDLQNLGEDHPSVATRRSNLAMVLKALGDLPRAKDLLEQALASDLHNLGENHPSVAINRSNLALVFQDLGDLPRAKDLLEQALASDLHNLGENHPSVATRRSNLALVLQDLGDLPRAKDLLELALASDLTNLGENHPSVATRRSNLATVLQALGDLPRAKDLLEQALASNLTNLGENHPSVATRRSNLATVLQALGDLPRAKDLLEQAVESARTNLGDEHPSVATYRANLAEVEKRMNTAAAKAPPKRPTMPETHDVFICHASEDKARFVEPLVAALVGKGLKVWYDRFEIGLGDDFRAKMNEGLRGSRFGVVLVSPSSFKFWPQAELGALFNQEARGRGEQPRILPVRCDLSIDELTDRDPLLAARRSIGWEDGLEAIVGAIVAVVERSRSAAAGATAAAASGASTAASPAPSPLPIAQPPAPRAAATRTGGGQIQGGVDLGIVIALPEELRQVLALVGDYARHPTTDLDAYVFTRNGYRCAAVLVGEMGQTQAGVFTERFIRALDPSIIVSMGVAGGLNDLRAGDIHVPTQSVEYLQDAKAQGTAGGGFAMVPGAPAYRVDYALLRAARALEFDHPAAFRAWRDEASRDLAALLPDPDKRQALIAADDVRAAVVALADGHVATGPVVGAARAFADWIRSHDRNVKSLEMESSAVVLAAQTRTDPRRALIIRAISDLGDERKKQLDNKSDGVLRRYAMRNAVRYLWALLDAGAFPRAATPGAGHG